MRKFEAKPLQEITGALQLTVGHLLGGEEKPPGKMRGVLERGLMGIRPHFEALHLTYSARKLERIIETLGDENMQDTKALISAVDELSDRITDELQGFHFFEVSADKVAYYEPAAPLFGDLVELSFPSASPEIQEAGKCFALGRYSATVYHLMRALEVGLQCMAKPHGVTFINTNWQNVLDQIEKHVNAMSSVTHGPDWKTQQQFFSEACVHFRMLKNAWRNYAMHLHERYDEERALEIWQSVRAFMRHLAKELQE